MVQTSLCIDTIRKASLLFALLKVSYAILLQGNIHFYLVSAAEVTGLKLALSEIPKMGYYCVVDHIRLHTGNKLPMCLNYFTIEI